MAKAYVFYNPFAGGGDWKKRLEKLRESVTDALVYCDLTKEETYELSLFELTAEDSLILCGGDGTLNRFINIIEGIYIPCEIFYYPIGTNNDFARDLGQKAGDRPFNITAYLKGLPKVEVGNRRYLFLNGICCGQLSEYFQKPREVQGLQPKSTNRSKRAVLRKLLLLSSPANMRVTVDGILHSYQKVWLALTMKGRFYGGMMPTPEQDRSNPESLLSIMILHNAGKHKAWRAFPSLLTGNHIRYKDVIEILTGHEIQVEFDQAIDLGLDGNIISAVEFYKATVHRFA